MRPAASLGWINAVQSILLAVSGLGLFGSLVPAFFAIIAPGEFNRWLWWWWLVLPVLIVALIAGSAMMARRSKPIAALAIVSPAALLGCAVAYFLVTIALA